MGKAMYGLVRFLKPFVRPFFPVKVFGPRKFEEKRTIFVMNHNSAWDPVVWTAYIKNRLRFMYKGEFRINKFLTSIFDALEFVPVSRGDADLAAIKKSLHILNNEGILAMFPEGTRGPETGVIRPLHTGAALLALKSRSPIRFFYSWDKYKPFHKNYIVVGEEITLEEYYGKKITKELLEEASFLLWEKLEALRRDTDEFLAKQGKKRRKYTKKEQAKLENFLKEKERKDSERENQEKSSPAAE